MQMLMMPYTMTHCEKLWGKQYPKHINKNNKMPLQKHTNIYKICRQEISEPTATKNCLTQGHV
jgi:hypothetical protein